MTVPRHFVLSENLRRFLRGVESPRTSNARSIWDGKDEPTFARRSVFDEAVWATRAGSLAYGSQSLPDLISGNDGQLGSTSGVDTDDPIAKYHFVEKYLWAGSEDDAGLSTDPGVTFDAIFIEIDCALASWASGSEQGLISQWSAAAGQRAWAVSIDATGHVVFEFSQNGTTVTESIVSADPVLFEDGERVRLRIDRYDYGDVAINQVIGDYTSYVELAYETGLTTGPLHASTEPVRVGVKAGFKADMDLYGVSVWQIEGQDYGQGTTAVADVVIDRDATYPYGDQIIAEAGTIWDIDVGTGYPPYVIDRPLLLFQDDIVTLGDLGGLDVGASDPFSVVVWVTTNDEPGPMFEKHDAGIGWLLTSSAAPFGQIDDGPNAPSIGDIASLAHGQMYQLALVRDVEADALRWYRDGVLIDTAIDTTTSTLVNGGAAILGGTGSSFGLSAAAFFNKVLSADDLLKLLTDVTLEPGTR